MTAMTRHDLERLLSNYSVLTFESPRKDGDAAQGQISGSGLEVIIGHEAGQGHVVFARAAHFEQRGEGHAVLAPVDLDLRGQGVGVDIVGDEAAAHAHQIFRGGYGA